MLDQDSIWRESFMWIFIAMLSVGVFCGFFSLLGFVEHMELHEIEKDYDCAKLEKAMRGEIKISHGELISNLYEVKCNG